MFAWQAEGASRRFPLVDAPRGVWEQFDFGGIFLAEILALPPAHSTACFRVSAWQEISGPVSRTKVLQCVSDLLTPAELSLVSAKSWRQVAVAWG